MSYQWNEHLDELVGEEIQHLRISIGLSQADLGAAIGVSFQQIQRHEAGRSPLTISRLARIATVLRVDPAHFFGRYPRSRNTALNTGAFNKAIGLLSSEDLELAAKIARIRDDMERRDLIASIDRLADALTLAQNQRSDQIS